MDEKLIEEVAAAIARARYLRDYGEELEEQFVPEMAARCVNEAIAAINVIRSRGVA